MTRNWHKVVYILTHSWFGNHSTDWNAASSVFEKIVLCSCKVSHDQLFNVVKMCQQSCLSFCRTAAVSQHCSAFGQISIWRSRLQKGTTWSFTKASRTPSLYVLSQHKYNVNCCPKLFWQLSSFHPFQERGLCDSQSGNVSKKNSNIYTRQFNFARQKSEQMLTLLFVFLELVHLPRLPCASKGKRPGVLQQIGVSYSKGKEQFCDSMKCFSSNQKL